MNVAPLARYEHPLFHAPATREPPDSGKPGLTIKGICLLLFALCLLLFCGCFGAAEADIIVAVIGIIVVADGAGNVLRIVVPRAATNPARRDVERLPVLLLQGVVGVAHENLHQMKSDLRIQLLLN